MQSALKENLHPGVLSTSARNSAELAQLRTVVLGMHSEGRNLTSAHQVLPQDVPEAIMPWLLHQGQDVIFSRILMKYKVQMVFQHPGVLNASPRITMGSKVFSGPTWTARRDF